jgi:hypothetical protein
MNSLMLSPTIDSKVLIHFTINASYSKQIGQKNGGHEQSSPTGNPKLEEEVGPTQSRRKSSGGGVAASGERSVGDFATEALMLGDSPPVHVVVVGCSHDNEGLFIRVVELLALSGGPLSFLS